MNWPLDVEPPLDFGIRPMVEVLVKAGVETFESCEGGCGHAYPVPTVRFHGDRSEGHRAFAAVVQAGLPVAELRRTWVVLDGEPTGPYWELTFSVPVDSAQHIPNTTAYCRFHFECFRVQCCCRCYTRCCYDEPSI